MPPSLRPSLRPALRYRLPWRALAYLLLAVVITWPAAAGLGRTVPGADRTDLWNALWSIWFFVQSVTTGTLPWHTALLAPPAGGSLLVADPLNAALALPLVPVIGLPAAYSILVIGQVAFSGWAAHKLAADVAGAAGLNAGVAGSIAGTAYATAPVLRAAIHNGSSEGIGGGFVALAAWACWRAAREGGLRRAVLAGLALLLAALASWYGAVVAFLFAGALALLGLHGRWRATLAARLGALLLGLALVTPLALATRAAVSAPDNLVRIKNPRELATVRRSTGPADIRGYFMPGDFRSPDFRSLSRYGEQFFHCHYLGWVILLGAGLSLRRRVDAAWLWLAGLCGLLLSLGPVAVRDGAAWIIMGDRAIPLPYLLVESLPGFSSLSLLYRLAQAPALAGAVLAGCGAAGVSGRGLVGVLGVAGVLLEGRFLSPLGALPGVVSVQVASSIVALADAPPGVVIDFPVVGGRRYLFEQTVHQHPMAGTLNFPNNAVGQRAWRGLAEAAAAVTDSASAASAGGGTLTQADRVQFRTLASHRARAAGVRYVVVHDDPWARPDMQDEAVRILEQALVPLATGRDDVGDVRVYALW
ncbi:MAG: hypothetical protein GXP62_17205 [Oligoflexia bacterium]|nr:hypothetical protein [Oligoflexia bacterium]